MVEDLKPIRIRAHHLLCMQGFQGYGYDKDFVDNLNAIIKSIKSNPDLKIIVINECDDICSQCPHNHSGVCIKEPDSDMKIKNMDNEVLKKLGRKSGSELKSRDIFEFVNKKIAGKRDLSIICRDCEWQSKCLLYISQ